MLTFSLGKDHHADRGVLLGVSLLKFSLGLALRQILSMRMARLAGRGVLLGVFLAIRRRDRHRRSMNTEGQSRTHRQHFEVDALPPPDT